MTVCRSYSPNVVFRHPGTNDTQRMYFTDSEEFGG